MEANKEISFEKLMTQQETPALLIQRQIYVRYFNDHDKFICKNCKNGARSFVIFKGNKIISSQSNFQHAIKHSTSTEHEIRKFRFNLVRYKCFRNRENREKSLKSLCKRILKNYSLKSLGFTDKSELTQAIYKYEISKSEKESNLKNDGNKEKVHSNLDKEKTFGKSIKNNAKENIDHLKISNELIKKKNFGSKDYSKISANKNTEEISTNKDHSKIYGESTKNNAKENIDHSKIIGKLDKEQSKNKHVFTDNRLNKENSTDHGLDNKKSNNDGNSTDNKLDKLNKEQPKNDRNSDKEKELQRTVKIEVNKENLPSTSVKENLSSNSPPSNISPQINDANISSFRVNKNSGSKNSLSADDVKNFKFYLSEYDELVSKNILTVKNVADIKFYTREIDELLTSYYFSPKFIYKMNFHVTKIHEFPSQFDNNLLASRGVEKIKFHVLKIKDLLVENVLPKRDENENIQGNSEENYGENIIKRKPKLGSTNLPISID